jgi:hypothetical protein
MKHLSIIVLTSAICCFAEVPEKKVSSENNTISEVPILVSLNNPRFSLMQDAAEEDRNESGQEMKKKSGILAAFLSAVVPGAGEFYAESYWKSALFAAIEITSWTLYATYTDKGETKDKEMRRYGDTYWSEQRYWSNIYAKSNNTNVTLLSEDFIRDNINELRAMEADPANSFSHTLPVTKTQQYYEMIYKYLHQFGAGWVEVGDNWGYYDNTENHKNLLPNVKHYRSLRNTSNDFYSNATTMANVAMFNHVVSAFDAAFSVKFYNKEMKYSLIAQPKYYAGEHFTSYGIALSW